jgi:2'-5' RNA ligase
LFFALWPDASVRVAIASLASQVGSETRGRAVASDNLHLTLAFLGERPAAMVPDLCESVAAIDISAFHLPLDDVGCWRKTGIAWLATSRSVPPLAALREGIVQALATLHIVIDERRYVPHVTLARRIESVVTRRLAAPIEWRVASFVLVASMLDPRGARYEVLRSWPAAP